jgi:hypothetical protein
MTVKFIAAIEKDQTLNATGIPVPAEAIAALGSHKKPKVKVSLNGYTYRSTVAVMGGLFMLPLSQEHRAAAGITPGDQVEVTLELDVESRKVGYDDLKAALSAQAGALEAESCLTRRKVVQQMNEAKAQETEAKDRQRIVTKMGDS